jgi:catechol 2,3-dioxygenase-like lactoylglutathione lyase family enzyme
MIPTRLLRIRLNVGDLDRAQTFFRDVLGFRIREQPSSAQKPARSTLLTLCKQEIELVETDPPGAPYPPGSTSADLWFQHFAIVTTDINAAYARLLRAGMTSITHGGPQTLPPEAGGVSAFKFRDPDGHPLELIQFPDAAHGEIGIDHSAISVSDAESSIAFYQLLGLRETTRQTNAGATQEHLDGLPDVVVDVIALAATGAPPPHLELLCYRQPRGRAKQRDPHDISDTKLVFAIDGLPGVTRGMETAGFRISCEESAASSHIVRDPDGHGIVLVAHSAATP